MTSNDWLRVIFEPSPAWMALGFFVGLLYGDEIRALSKRLLRRLRKKR